MDRKPHILVVDDDREIRDLLSRYLERHGLRVTTAADGTEMSAALEDRHIDLIVLDLMLPGEDGLALTRRIRTESAVPIIMLTAMGEEVDRILGLEMGTDDYMAKPFNPRELTARIRAVLRRAGDGATTGPVQGAQENRIAFGDFVLAPRRREAFHKNGEPLELSETEYDLLAVLAANPNRVLSRDRLLDMTKGRLSSPFDRSVDIGISRLRAKLGDDPRSPEYIRTVRGGGYMFVAQTSEGPLE